jgi:hypothetical protein
MMLHLPSASLEMKNPYTPKKAGTLEQYGTIATIVMLFRDKV